MSFANTNLRKKRVKWGLKNFPLTPLSVEYIELFSVETRKKNSAYSYTLTLIEYMHKRKKTLFRTVK